MEMLSELHDSVRWSTNSLTASMSDPAQNMYESGMISLNRIQVAMTSVLIGCRTHSWCVFEEWYTATQHRPGVFSKDDRAKMFISHQIYQSLKITVYSRIEVTKFLLSAGMKFVFV